MIVNAQRSLAAGLAIALTTPVLADPAVSESPTRAGKLAEMRIQREPVDLTTPRGGTSFFGEFVTMRDELENFPLDTSFGGNGVSSAPTSFTGPAGFQWPMNNLRGQASTNYLRLVDLSSAQVGGSNGVVNATRAIQLHTGTPQAAGGFHTGYNLRFGGQTGVPTLSLFPTLDHNARVSAEHFISTIDQLFTFEPVSVFSGYIIGRFMWGGVCVENTSGECTGIGLPIGLLSTIYALGPCSNGFCAGGEFFPIRYCTTKEGNPIPGCVPHPGFAVGDHVPPPIANWSRFAAETTADGRVRLLLDRFDGAGETIVSDQMVFTTNLLDRVGSNTSFESQDAFMLVDNIEASGPYYEFPVAPALACPYLDDMEWLFFGPLFGQSQRWTAALTSGAAVINDAQRGQVISQVNNVYPDNHYRREVSTELPTSFASLASDRVVTMQVRTTGTTVRGIALVDGNDAAARIFLGREDPNDPESPFFEPSIYVQINPEYDPIDDPEAIDPYVNIPVIGVDVVDTNLDWVNGVYHTIEFRRSANGAMRISIDGQRIFAGRNPLIVFPSRLAFESENQAFGSGSQFRVNDVTFACDAPSCATDMNVDDRTDFADLNIVLSNFGAFGLPDFEIPPGDADGDFRVDFDDLNAVLSAYGTNCE